jgi:N-acetylglutamate synthase-like GNAT family acetyltransferase
MKYFAWGADRLAGLMILSIQHESLKVESICTHPDSKGVGVMLIKRAIKESIKCGKKGVLTLTDMSISEFYDRLGFKKYIDGAPLKKRLNESDADELLRSGLHFPPPIFWIRT